MGTRKCGYNAPGVALAGAPEIPPDIAKIASNLTEMRLLADNAELKKQVEKLEAAMSFALTWLDAAKNPVAHGALRMALQNQKDWASATNTLARMPIVPPEGEGKGTE